MGFLAGDSPCNSQGELQGELGYISKTVKDRHIQFLLKSNRKSYALYRMVALPMTLSAP